MSQRVPWAKGHAPATWAEVTWPEWVPRSVIEQVESFYSASHGRKPISYEESANASYNNSPDFGEELTLPGWSPGEVVQGRWVFAWNNIGRVIAADGTVQYASTCHYRRIAE